MMGVVRVGFAAVCCCALVACSPLPAPAPSTPTPTAQASVAVDYTKPGAAASALKELMDAAGSDDLLMVVVSRTDATIAVFKKGKAETWSFRKGKAQQVQSDTTYVDQAQFALEQFDVSDVGKLFRAAAAVSGSTDQQELQIVDFSGGDVTMTVSTNPESRTVFFTRDGHLLPTLDFTSLAGLQAGFDDVTRGRTTALRIGFGRPSGVYLDERGSEEDSVSRRLRTARVPVTTSPQNKDASLKSFTIPTTLPMTVWQVLQVERAAGRFTFDQEWTCVATSGEKGVTLTFEVAGRRFVTDAQGVRQG